MAMRSAWGKSAAQGREIHHLAHHAADVAAVFLALARQTAWRSRLETAAGRALCANEIECLAALVFLHDIGKLAPGFQAKAWPEAGCIRPIGHLEAGWRWIAMPRPDALAGAIR
jgi:CRISPR-associated endonuclease/helicase Cas3